jgi:hypothetical protein
MENSEVKQSGFRCPDCGGQKSTEKTVRCWDCAMVAKNSKWQKNRADRATAILKDREAGMSMVDIAAKNGVSRQRAYQIVGASGLPLTNKDRRGGKRD